MMESTHTREFNATHEAKDAENLGGFTSFGPKGQTAIQWVGSLTNGNGVQPIDVIRAALDRVKFLQKTTSASEPNGKLLFALTKAVEEFDGVKPTMGGELNNLIPKG